MNKDQKLLIEAYSSILINEQAQQGLEVSNDVLFAFDKADLTPQGKQVLQNLANIISKYGPDYLQKGVKVNITGHTDLYGTPNINNPLSQKRAAAVETFLKQILPQTGAQINITSQGVGSSQPKPEAAEIKFPLVNNKAPEQGKQQQQPNRRVEMTFNPPLPSQVTVAVKKEIPQLGIISSGAPNRNQFTNTSSTDGGQISNTPSAKYSMQYTPMTPEQKSQQEQQFINKLKADAASPDRAKAYYAKKTLRDRYSIEVD